MRGTYPRSPCKFGEEHAKAVEEPPREVQNRADAIGSFHWIHDDHENQEAESKPQQNRLDRWLRKRHLSHLLSVLATGL